MCQECNFTCKVFFLSLNVSYLKLLRSVSVEFRIDTAKFNWLEWSVSGSLDRICALQIATVPTTP